MARLQRPTLNAILIEPNGFKNMEQNTFSFVETNVFKTSKYYKNNDLHLSSLSINKLDNNENITFAPVTLFDDAPQL